MLKQMRNRVGQKMAQMKRKVLDSYKYGTAKHIPKGKGK